MALPLLLHLLPVLLLLLRLPAQCWAERSCSNRMRSSHMAWGARKSGRSARRRKRPANTRASSGGDTP